MKNKTNPKVVILGLLCIALLFTSFYFYFKSQGVVNPFLVLLKTSKSSNNCEAGYSQKEDFLETYTVKSGDTLLSIAKNQLKDTSRANEIVGLNKDRYPQLSLQTPFLEQGWKLFLPPLFASSPDGALGQVKGVLIGIRDSDKAWEVGGSTGSHFMSFLINKNTIIDNSESIKPGDCIKAIVDNNTGRVFKVSPQ